MEYKAFPFAECKSEENGRFRGLAAAFAKDLYGDVIAEGAFTKSIKKSDGKIPLLLDHHGAPIGFSTELYEDSKGLRIAGVLSLESSRGADVYAILKTAETVKYRMGLSIGFIAEKWDMVEEKDGSLTRVLTMVDVLETSITAFPANPRARVDSVKSLRDFEELLRDAGGCSREGAKRVLARLAAPYLSVDTDGNQPRRERDARCLRQAIQQARACHLLRAAIGGI